MDKAEEKKTVENSDALPKNDLLERIKAASAGLYYISETDAEITPFTGGQIEDTSKEAILKQIKGAADSPVEERDFTDFFTRFTKIEDWFEEEEKETAGKFSQLKELLEKNLRDLKVFKIGKIQLDVYVVGLDAENHLTGIKTKAVET